MTADTLDNADKIPTLSTAQRVIVLAAAFLGWMFAGLEMSNFNQITRAATADLRGYASTDAGLQQTAAQGAVALRRGAPAG